MIVANRGAPAASGAGPVDAEAAAPDVSVVVPVRNGARTLGRTLSRLAEQDFAGRWEVVVVDDGSTDETARIATAAGARVVRHDRALGPGAARNSGAAAADAELLAFTDADCEPCRSWLTAGVGALRAGADLVQGAVAPPPHEPVGPLDRTLWVTGESGLFESANLFVRRRTFDRVGGFPDFWPGAAAAGSRYPPPGFIWTRGEAPIGEDVCFGWRAKRAGARTSFCAEALAYHEVVRLGMRGMLAYRARVRFFPALVREVPELRDAFLYRRWFLTRRSAAFQFAAVGLLGVVAGRRPALATAALPYLAVAVREDGGLRRGTARRTLTKLPLDATAALALLVGSVAARRIVL